MQTKERIRTLVIDRFFQDASGDQWIVDFKTSRHEGSGLEEFLDEQRARYETQLSTYAVAVIASRLALYFPLLRGWREWKMNLRTDR
jgi:ATP-dependent exoDNAse (exonuclease V) beta subunit